ncbi:MAG: ABC transporter transmembrane domain-containing protein, partial [Pseudomonadota bacterium]
AAAFGTRAIFAALHADEPLTVSLLIWLGGAGVLAALAQYVLSVTGEKMGQGYAASIRQRLYEHASRSPQSELAKRRMGYHLLRFSGDLKALTAWPSRGLPRLIEACVLLPAALLVLWALHARFAWIAGATVCLTALSLALTYPSLKKLYESLRARRARLVADMAERVPVAAQLAAMGRRAKELARLSSRTDAIITMAMRARRLEAALKFLPEATVAIVACCVVWLGARDGLPADHLAAALAALTLTLRPLRNVTRALQQRAMFLAAYDKLRLALKRETVSGERSGLRLPRGPLSLTVIDDAGKQHVIAPGTTCKSGHKTALDLEHLAPILTGAQPAEPARLFLNDIDLCDLDPYELGRRVGVLSDRPLILKGSLRRNLTLGLPNRPRDKEIRRKIDAAGHSQTLGRLGPLSRRLPERGGDLTQEDRIKLSLLRAVIQMPGLVVVLAPMEDQLDRAFENSTLLRV